MNGFTLLLSLAHRADAVTSVLLTVHSDHHGKKRDRALQTVTTHLVAREGSVETTSICSASVFPSSTSRSGSYSGDGYPSQGVINITALTFIFKFDLEMLVIPLFLVYLLHKP
jgi:hypothetical protein